MQRKLFREIGLQATGLANQLPAYTAQEPMHPHHSYTHIIPALQHVIQRPTFSADVEQESLTVPYDSDYQALVLNNKPPQKLRVASLNCRGLSSISRRERITHLMSKRNLDILCLQETKINSNLKELHDRYVMFWSSGISDDQRNKATELKRSGKASSRNTAHKRIFNEAIEHLGVGIIYIYTKALENFVADVRQHDARNIVLTLQMQAGFLDVISTYAPQACHADDEASEKHYSDLNKLLQTHYSYSPRLILGDFNARIIKALPYESHCFGPFTLGNSWADLGSLSDAQLNNRARFAQFCRTNR